MAVALTVLDTITIETPCTIPWNDMRGDDRTRFCSKCSKNVHDISEMTAAEAVQLLNVQEQTPCVRLYRRSDRRVMTSDCPKTLRERTWKWLSKRSSWVASLFAMVFMLGCGEKQANWSQGVPCEHLLGKPTGPSFEVLPMPRERIDAAPMPHEPTKA